jgi:predicted PurR-regulated permease PerM
METLVATVLIVIIYMLASMILNNLFSNTINKNTKAVETHLNELQYLQLHDQLQIPYSETFQNWNISIESYQEKGQSIIEFDATNLKTKKTISFNKNANQ